MSRHPLAVPSLPSHASHMGSHSSRSCMHDLYQTVGSLRSGDLQTWVHSSLSQTADTSIMSRTPFPTPLCLSRPGTHYPSGSIRKTP
jgi:hypothetical protein